MDTHTQHTRKQSACPYMHACSKHHTAQLAAWLAGYLVGWLASM